MIIPCQSLHAIYIKHFPLQPQHEPLWTAAIGVLRRFSGIYDEFREDFVQFTDVFHDQVRFDVALFQIFERVKL